MLLMSWVQIDNLVLIWTNAQRVSGTIDFTAVSKYLTNYLINRLPHIIIIYDSLLSYNNNSILSDHESD